MLEVTREDLSPGRPPRLCHLDAVGDLRAAGRGIVQLRLEDIDWRRDVLRVRHSKTGTYSELPLLTEPGEAVLRYVEKARPSKRTSRGIPAYPAPHRPFKERLDPQLRHERSSASSRSHPQGRKGPHAFRHARAVSLLRSGVPLKIIGDMLGHTSAAATAEYLKLATEDLRAIGLELPGGVSP